MSSGARVSVDSAVGPPRRWRMVFLGLSITSSWGNGHATTYRALLRALAARGHELLFLERDVPWYAENRDLPTPPFCRTELYASLDELQLRFTQAVRDADVVVVGSYVPDGIAVGDWVLGAARGLTAFYDIDTPVTLRALVDGNCEYLQAGQIGRYGLYLSFTGGPTLDRLAREHGARSFPLYCAVDPNVHVGASLTPRWELGYLGTYSPDRQPVLEALMLDPARRISDAKFVVAGPLYPEDLTWPTNVERLTHVAPGEHRQFYCEQRFTLNVTRADMKAAGYSPSVRLFEAAACGVPIISDAWPGLDHFFTEGREMFVSRSAEETVALLRGIGETERRAVAERARARVLAEHTASHRAVELERYISTMAEQRSRGLRVRA